MLNISKTCHKLKLRSVIMAAKKILIVDDDPDITYAMQMILEGHCFQVCAA